MPGSKGRSGGPRVNSGGARPNSGGARAGAGRPRKKSAASDLTNPLEFLRAVWQGQIEASPDQVRAASAALPYVLQKLSDGGKKDARKEAAEAAAGGRFSGANPPRLVRDNTKVA